MMRKSTAFTLPILSLVCLLLLAACSSGVPVLRYLTITPQSATGTVGATVAFTAQAYYSDGSIKDGTSFVIWASSNTAVATISGGVATPVASGTTTITASAHGVPTVSAALTVNQLLTITVTPANPTVLGGQTQQFAATGNFSDGSSSDISSQVFWFSQTTSVATITSGGLATVVGSGSSLISASLYGVTGNTTLTAGAAGPVSLLITPASSTIAVGNTVGFTVVEVWSDSSQHAPSGTVTWSSGAATTANVLVNAATSAAATVVGVSAGGPVTITASEGTLTAGTASVTVSTGSTHFAYVSNSGDGTIEWYTVTASTSPYLTAPAGNTLGSMPHGPPTQTIIDPNGQFLFFTDTSPEVNTAVINSSTGALTFPTGAPVAGGAFSQPAGGAGDITFEAVDPFGRFVYVSSDGSTSGTSSIAGFTINSDGSLTPIAMSSSPFTTNLSSPECLIIDKTGSYLYATNLTGNTVSAYSIDQTTGALTPLSTPTFATGSGPFLGGLDPTGTYLYVADGTDNTVAAFSIGSGGLLTSLGTPTTVTGASSILNLVVDPSGTHLYVLDTGSSTNGQVFGFNIGTGGTIGSAISGTPINTGNSPLAGIAIDPTGKLLAVENNFPDASNNYTISLYTIGSGGALTAQTPVATGTSPLYVTFYNAAP